MNNQNPDSPTDSDTSDESATATPRFTVRRVSDLRDMPPVRWLISGIIPEAKLSTLYGKYGCGKSFVGLDMLLCLDTGRAWHGHKVLPSPGRVIYIAAEGVSGILQRVEAWKLEHFMEADPGLLVIGEAPRLPDLDDIGVLVETIRDHLGPDTSPALIVIDTLARSMAGYDEYHSKEMGLAVEGASLLQRVFGCHVMLVHHTGKTDNGPRGSVALPAAVDTEIKVKGEGNIISISCEKQKDGKAFPELRCRLKAIELPGHEDDDEFSTNGSSCVLVDDVPESVSSSKTKHRESQLGPADRAVLKAFAQFPTLTELKYTDIKSRAGIQGGPLARAIEKLVKLGYVYTIGDGKDKRYVKTEVGTKRAVPTGSEDEPETTMDSDFDLGTGSECTNLYQGVPTDSPDDQESLVQVHTGTHPYRGVPSVPSVPTHLEPDIADGKRTRTKSSRPKRQKEICTQCGMPGSHEMYSGHMLCKDHWEAYIPSETDDPRKMDCPRCGKRAWGFAPGGPENGYVCSSCLPSLLNGEQEQKRAG